MKIIISLRILTALIFVASAVSMTAQEVSIPDPGLNAAIRDVGVSTNALGKIVFTDGTAHLSPQQFYRARFILPP